MRKISREIKIGRIIFLPTDRSIKNIDKQILKSIKKLKDFYNISISNINIELVYSRKELNKKMDKFLDEKLKLGIRYGRQLRVSEPWT